eukprot:scaffold11.g4002.t1
MAAGDHGKEIEEQFVLRVRDPALADAIRRTLRQEGGADPAATKAQLLFEASDKRGKFVWEGREYPVTVLALPTVVESYKTYDDVNLCKSADVGQMLVVGDATDLVGPGGESVDGVTPPMRGVQGRLFRRQLDVSAELVENVEYDLLTILGGGAPEGLKFVDHEEEWQVDQATGQGRWVQRGHAAVHFRSAARSSRLARPAVAAIEPPADEDDSESSDEEDDWDNDDEELLAGQEAVWGPPAIVLAGFPTPLLAAVRLQIDLLGGEGIAVIPATPQALHAGSVAECLAQPEPAWDAPLPAGFVEGGGWGKVRMALFSGLSLDQQALILQVLDDEDLGPVWGATATASNGGMQLGAVLADALQQHRSAGAGALDGGPERFVDELPDLDDLLLKQAGGKQQAPAGQQRKTEQRQAPAAEAAAEAAALPSARASGAAAPDSTGSRPAPLEELAELPADIIDRIASGSLSASTEQQEVLEPLQAARQPGGCSGGKDQEVPATGSGSGTASSGTRKPWELGSSGGSGSRRRPNLQNIKRLRR